MRIIRIVALCCLLLLSVFNLPVAQAQTTIVSEPEVEMADELRRDGKIYVVVAVLLTVLGGMIVYLISLDRKVTKLEKQVKDTYANR